MTAGHASSPANPSQIHGSSSQDPPSGLQRPFKVLGIQQIAIGGPDKHALKKLWVDMFGLEVTGTFQSERENVDEDICAMGVGPLDRKSTRLNSSHIPLSRMPSSA